MNYVREYWGRISSGEIVTSRRVKAVYGRLMQEMDAPSDDSAYYFDEETGERPILFIEQFCKQSQGTLGAALKLELFQKAFIQTLFGWLEKIRDTGDSAKRCFWSPERTAKRRCLRLSRCICLSRTMRARRKSIP